MSKFHSDINYCPTYVLNNKLYIYERYRNEYAWAIIDLNTEEITIKEDDSGVSCNGIIYCDGFFYCINTNIVYRTNIEDLHWELYKTLTIKYVPKNDGKTVFSITNDNNVYVFKHERRLAEPIGMYVLDCPSFEEKDYIPYPNNTRRKKCICKPENGICGFTSQVINDKIIIFTNEFDFIFDTSKLSFTLIDKPHYWDHPFFFLYINNQYYYNYGVDEILLKKYIDGEPVTNKHTSEPDVTIGKCKTIHTFSHYDGNNIIIVYTENNSLVIKKFKYP